MESIPLLLFVYFCVYRVIKFCVKVTARQDEEKARVEAKNWEKAVTDKELEIEIDEYIKEHSKEALERIRSFYREDSHSTVGNLSNSYVRKFYVRLLLTQYGKIPCSDIYESKASYYGISFGEIDMREYMKRERNFGKLA